MHLALVSNPDDISANIQAFDEQVREIATFDFFDAEEVLTRLGMSFDEE